MPKHDETPRQVDWDTVFELVENAPPLKKNAAQATERGENAKQPAA